MELVGGVLEKLVGEWKFTALAEGCQVLFKVDFGLAQGLGTAFCQFFPETGHGFLSGSILQEGTTGLQGFAD